MFITNHNHAYISANFTPQAERSRVGSINRVTAMERFQVENKEYLLVRKSFKEQMLRKMILRRNKVNTQN